MIRVDLICGADHLPRIRLLEDFLRLQGIDLRVRRELPARPTPRVIVVPGRRAPLVLPGAGQSFECIGLYLDHDAPPMEADFHVHIHTWPARSSDHDVNRLAAYLRRPVRRSGPRGERTDTRTSPRRRRQNSAAVVVLIAIVAGVILVFASRNGTEPDDAKRLPDPTAASPGEALAPGRGPGLATQGATPPESGGTTSSLSAAETTPAATPATTPATGTATGGAPAAASATTFDPTSDTPTFERSLANASPPAWPPPGVPELPECKWPQAVLTQLLDQTACHACRRGLRLRF